MYALTLYRYLQMHNFRFSAEVNLMTTLFHCTPYGDSDRTFCHLFAQNHNDKAHNYSFRNGV